MTYFGFDAKRPMTYDVIVIGLGISRGGAQKNSMKKDLKKTCFVEGTCR